MAEIGYNGSGGFGPGFRVSSEFEAKRTNSKGEPTLHGGTDFGDFHAGTPVPAAADGVVIRSGPANGYGYSVTIEHKNYFTGEIVYSVYGHLSPSTLPAVGTYFSRGQTVGHVATVGELGQSPTPLNTSYHGEHPHIEVVLQSLIDNYNADKIPGKRISMGRGDYRNRTDPKTIGGMGLSSSQTKLRADVTKFDFRPYSLSIPTEVEALFGQVKDVLESTIENRFENAFGQFDTWAQRFDRYSRETNTGQCFAAGTLIAMADGSREPIEAIRPGDLVLAFDGAVDRGRGPTSAAAVRRLYSNVTTEWIVLTLADGTELTVTPGHAMLGPDGNFAKLQDLIEAAERGQRPLRLVSKTGALVDATYRRIAYGEATRALYEEANDVLYGSSGATALRPEPVNGWRTYNFEVTGLPCANGL